MGENSSIEKEKKELYREQARNRAGQSVSHLIYENSLTKMWTLTYEKEITDRKQALDDFKKFVMRLSYNLQKKIDYVAVIEVQKKRQEKTGKAVLHFHMAMRNFYIEKEYFQQLWGHGNVRFSTFADGRRIPNSKQAVATYMSKYLKKDMIDNPKLAGQKMYLNSQGLKRPPKGHGILEDETWNRLEIYGSVMGSKYDIAKKPNLRGYTIETSKLPDDVMNGHRAI